MKREPTAGLLSVCILILAAITFLGCKKDIVPVLRTLQVVNITDSSAESGGKITEKGSHDVIARGVVWGFETGPTIEHHQGKTSDGMGTGTYTSNLVNLQPNTRYYVRSYAVNAAGTAYGSQRSFVTSTPPVYPSGFVHCDPSDITAIVEVTNPVTGRTWMDRNLGASRVATSSTDSLAYGDLYQWGRFADGHQCRTSATTTILSSSDQPGHGNFIIVNDGPYDWRSPQNNILWQGVEGINNPCPSGYRLPTITEWHAERQSWISDDPEGAFASPLKLTMAGFRNRVDGALISAGLSGSYRSSSAHQAYSPSLAFDSNIVLNGAFDRASGQSVRCIKDE